MKSPPGAAALTAVMVNVLLVACLLWILVTAARKWLPEPGLRLTEVGFLLFLAVPLNSIRAVAAQYCSYLKSPLFELLGTRGVAALAITLATAGLAGVVLFHRKAAPFAGSLVAVLLPFCAVTFGQAAWRITRVSQQGFTASPPAPPLPD